MDSWPRSYKIIGASFVAAVAYGFGVLIQTDDKQISYFMPE